MKSIKTYIHQYELRCRRYWAIRAYIEGKISRLELTIYTNSLIKEGLKQ